jgi:hypothetical protein
VTVRRVAPPVAVAIAGLAILACAAANVVSGGNVRVSFRGWIAPRTLPRGEPAPVRLHFAGHVAPLPGKRPEQLRRVRIEINRNGVVTTRGLPSCPLRELRSTTTMQALSTCRRGLVGEGHFTSHIDIPDQAPFPALGRVLAFNTRAHGHTMFVAHVFGTHPLPVSQVLPMSLHRESRGSFGTTLIVEMPKTGRDWGYVTGFDLTLERSYRYRGRTLSLLSASCPAPRGVRRAPFTAARGTYELAGGRSLTRTLSGTCKVRRRPSLTR